MFCGYAIRACGDHIVLHNFNILISHPRSICGQVHNTTESKSKIETLQQEIDEDVKSEKKNTKLSSQGKANEGGDDDDGINRKCTLQ